MMKYLFLLAFLSTSVITNAQTVSVVTDSSEYFQKPLKVAQIMPEFLGGEKAMMNYIGQHLSYPSYAIESYLEGTVRLRFTVTRTGKLIHPIVISEVLGGGLEEEAIRVLKSMPNWKPGKQNGKAVAVYFELPFKFKIN